MSLLVIVFAMIQFYPEKRGMPILLVCFLLIVIVFSSYDLASNSCEV